MHPGDLTAAAWQDIKGVQSSTTALSIPFYLFDSSYAPVTSAVLTWVAYASVDDWAALAVPTLSTPSAAAVSLSLPLPPSAMSTISVLGDPTAVTGATITFVLTLYSQYGYPTTDTDLSVFSSMIVLPTGVRQDLTFVFTDYSSAIIANFTPTLIGMHQLLARHSTQGLLTLSSPLFNENGGFSVDAALTTDANKEMVSALLVGPLMSSFITSIGTTCTYAWTADRYGNAYSTGNTVSVEPS